MVPSLECSVCGYDLESEFIVPFMHPILRVGMCRVCFENFTEGMSASSDGVLASNCCFWCGAKRVTLPRRQRCWTSLCISQTGAWCNSLGWPPMPLRRIFERLCAGRLRWAAGMRSC